MTKGEKLVVMEHTQLSDSQKTFIKLVKNLFALHIDEVDAMKKDGRLKAMVVTKLEDACMYYVKLIASEDVENNSGVTFKNPVTFK